MKVAIISLTRFGATSLEAAETAKALNRLADVLVIASQDGYRQYWDKNLNVAWVPTGSSRWENLRRTGDVRSYLNIRRLVTRFSPEVIHYPQAHVWVPTINLFIPRRIPVVQTIHDPVGRADERNWWFQAAVQKLAIGRAQQIITLGEAHRTTFKRLGIPESKVNVIPVTSDFSFYKRVAEPAISEVSEENAILFFGRLESYKGTDILLDAFDRLAKKYSDLKLIMAGRGELGDLEPRIKSHPRIELHYGWIPDEEVAGFFARSKIVVLPYVDASQSGVIPVAYSLGKPVVVTCVGAIPEQVEDGVTGLLVEPQNPQALASAVEWLLDHEAERLAMGANALAKAGGDAAWERIAKKTLAVYQKAIAGEVET